MYQLVLKDIIGHMEIYMIHYDSYDENLLRKFQYPETNPFYIMTDEYNVYKCLNNNSSISTEKPTGQFLIPFETRMVIYGNLCLMFQKNIELNFIF